MKTISAIILALLICATAGLTTTVFVQRNLTRNLEAKLATLQLAQTDTQTAIATRQGTIELLETKLGQMTQALTNSTANLAAVSERLRDYQIKEQAQIETASDRPQKKDEVPPPVGTPPVTFPKVLSKGGRVLAVNATYVKYPGRRLVFRPTEGNTFAVDVEEIHPQILEYLKLDKETVVAEQQRVDSAWRAKTVSDTIALERSLRLQQEAAESRAAVAREKAVADAELTKANAAASVAQSERTKAEAASRLADAAMINALNPQPPAVIQNVNQNVNRYNSWR